jgi:hypothetical protein
MFVGSVVVGVGRQHNESAVLAMPRRVLHYVFACKVADVFGMARGSLVMDGHVARCQSKGLA